MNELLTFVVFALESVPMNYMLTGSFALNFYTIPRATRDIDLVVELQVNQKDAFLSRFGSRFHLNEQTVADEFSGNGIGMFNLIDQQTFYKVDFIVRKKDRYEQVKFSNRRRVNMHGTDVWIISPEDLVLSKMQWIQQLESERQKDDIRQLLRMGDLKFDYIKSWAAFLNLTTYNLLP